MKKVLLIEDNRDTVTIWKMVLGPFIKNEKLLLLTAVSIDEARERFKLNQDIDAIFFDGCIVGPGKEPNTEILVSEFKMSFSGSMIAASGEEKYREVLLKAGCSHSCNKEDVPKMLVNLLGLG